MNFIAIFIFSLLALHYFSVFRSSLFVSLNYSHLPVPVIHWHLNGMTDKGLPSKPIWIFAFWLSSEFGSEGNSRMSQADMWIALLLNRINQCTIDI